jgi:arginine deiminase
MNHRVRYFRPWVVLLAAVLLATIWLLVSCATNEKVAPVREHPVPEPVSARPVPEVGCRAEWHRPKTVLMHTPGEELFAGVIHPAAALFEKAFSIEFAAKEHRTYIRRLRNHGATVYTVVDVLLKGTVDERGAAIPGPDLDALRNFAVEFLTIDASALPEDMRSEQPRYVEETLKQLHPRELVSLILRQPTVHLYSTQSNTGLGATYGISPVMNLYFLRDQMITTAKGVVMAKMNSAQRAPETRIIKFVLSKLKIRPIYEVTGGGRLEGGDYLPAGDVALLGQGLRTNAEGVRQLLENKVFGLPRVAIVKDKWKNQEQMHLDTYFNIIGPRLAVLVEERLSLPGKPAAAIMRPQVDLYELKDGRYRCVRSNMDFQEFLEKDLGFKLIPVPRDDQLRYGINFLTIAPDRILAIDGVSEKYKRTLAELGVNATWMDFRNLTGGYGAAHCTTQVLHREAPPQ